MMNTSSGFNVSVQKYKGQIDRAMNSNNHSQLTNPGFARNIQGKIYTK